ncbi:MAG: nucleotidyl transferase AbiEii/AbiGii toxin family protein [Vicinamibacteria bacterium]|nr:nucleotidyl transferase AbiEii/AbiGii toxin family protein [Vicinamibacteria bacterium]
MPPEADPLAALPEVQRRVLRASAAAIAERGFLLGGGTALALVYAHRRSVDFDWFVDAPLGEPMQLAAGLRAAGVELTVTGVERGTLHATIDGVRVSFLEYRYPPLAPPIAAAVPPARLLSLDDLAAMKLSAAAQRGSRKDFVDLYVLATRHRPLAALLECYRAKFGIDDVGHVLFALGYFDDAEAEPMPEMLWPLGWDEVRQAMGGWVRDLART